MLTLWSGPPDPPLGFSNVEVACFSDTPDHLVPSKCSSSRCRLVEMMTLTVSSRRSSIQFDHHGKGGISPGYCCVGSLQGLCKYDYRLAGMLLIVPRI